MKGDKIMIFLIEYNRSKGSVVKFKKYRKSQRVTAEKYRLKMELDLHSRAVNHEVVLLDAASEKDLRRTHRRYFESVKQIGRSIRNYGA